MLTVTDLSLAYDDEAVLEGVDLHVPEGEFVSLVGPSGSGKSSLLRAVAGLVPVRSGTVELGVPSSGLGVLFQDDALLPWRTARQNVALGLKIRGDSRDDARTQADDWLERLGLAGFGNRFPHQLSGGQRKRVALAQVLALKPRFLLMDEPLASLDAILRTSVTQDLLQWVEGQGFTVLLVTHDLEEALTLSDQVCLLSGGPGAHIRQTYTVPFERPRDVVGIRSDQRFGRLLAAIWQDMSQEVGMPA